MNCTAGSQPAQTARPLRGRALKAAVQPIFEVSFSPNREILVTLRANRNPYFNIGILMPCRLAVSIAIS